MDARTGVQFLTLLYKEGRVGGQDIEKAIKIAESKSPSASFDAAVLYARMIGKDQMTSLPFAKGTRWLAVLHRDEEQSEFKKIAVALRKMVGDKP